VEFGNGEGGGLGSLRKKRKRTKDESIVCFV
jgi:hypothetical protein